METNPNPSPSSSPNSSSSNGIRANPPPLPPTPKSLPPQPTTFVQADPHSFKQMVQRLTGSADTNTTTTRVKNPIPPLSRPKKPSSSSSFKLYERRPSMKNLKTIGPLITSTASAARAPLSPSVLDFPSLALSPVTPLIPDPFDRSPPDPNPNPNPVPTSAEERAIADRGFYLHPSPRGAEPPPRLLPLFPLGSPRDSAISSKLADIIGID